MTLNQNKCSKCSRSSTRRIPEFSTITTKTFPSKCLETSISRCGVGPNHHTQPRMFQLLTATICTERKHVADLFGLAKHWVRWNHFQNIESVETRVRAASHRHFRPATPTVASKLGSLDGDLRCFFPAPSDGVSALVFPPFPGSQTHRVRGPLLPASRAGSFCLLVSR